MKLVLLFISGLAGLVLAGPLPSSEAERCWSCGSVEKAQQVNQCRARCREANDAKSKGCDDAYRQCAFACSGSDIRDCRNRCRATYQSCRAGLPQELERCANACVVDNGCTP